MDVKIKIPDLIYPGMIVPDMTYYVRNLLLKCVRHHGVSGVGISEHGPSYLETAFYAANLINLLPKDNDQELNIISLGLIEYIKSYKVGNKGFADNHNGGTLLFANYYAITSLFILGDDVNEYKTITDIEKEKENIYIGIYPKYDNFPSDLISLYWIIVILTILEENNFPSEVISKIKNYLESFKKENGGYSPYPMKSSHATVHASSLALIIIKILSIDIETADTITFINSCRQRGWFSTYKGTPPTHLDTAYGNIIVGSLYENKLLVRDSILNKYNDLWRTYIAGILSLPQRIAV